MRVGDPDPEQELRDAFAAGGTGAATGPGIVERARAIADRSRRRRDIGVALGSGAAALALVGGLVVVPQMLGGDRPAGGPIAVAASGSPSEPSAAEPSVLPSTYPSDLPTATPSEVPSARIPDWPTARPGPAATIPDSVLPSMVELGSAMTTEGNRLVGGVGTAPLMGVHYCDSIDVSTMPGGDTVIRPVTGALMSGYKAPNGEISADVTVNLFAIGEGAPAMAQLLADRGFCRWFEATPTLAEPAGGAGAGESYWTFTGSSRPGQLAGGVARRGDVIVGVMTARATTAEALAEAKRLLILTTDRVVAQMPEAKG